jgi:hypothetical protein
MPRFDVHQTAAIPYPAFGLPLAAAVNRSMKGP